MYGGKWYFHFVNIYLWDSKWRVTLRITGFMDFAHRPYFKITWQHNVSETGSVSIFRLREGDAYCVGSLRRVVIIARRSSTWIYQCLSGEYCPFGCKFRGLSGSRFKSRSNRPVRVTPFVSSKADHFKMCVSSLSLLAPQARVCLGLLHGFVTVQFSSGLGTTAAWLIRDYTSSVLCPLICMLLVALPRNHAPASVTLRVTGGESPLHDKAAALEEADICLGFLFRSEFLFPFLNIFPEFS
jgi:hypothetical protein